MKGFKFVVFVFVLMTVQTAFAMSVDKDHGMRERSFIHRGKMADEHRRNGMMESRGDRGFLVKIFGLEPLMEKYHIQIEKVYFEAREKKLSLLQKRRQGYRRLRKLLNRNIENTEVRKSYFEVLGSLYEIQKEISAINDESMEKIKKIHAEQEKEMYRVLDKKMKILGENPEELKDLFEEMKSYNR